ncbi:uncharacterized protein [Dermacentor andersoni]|uniref:uncharacterized protein isoform X2 n=1 Tax=Dermacentor andersoni TaxID=34620 RepID=UPI003B3B8591
MPAIPASHHRRHLLRSHSATTSLGQSVALPELQKLIRPAPRLTWLQEPWQRGNAAFRYPGTRTSCPSSLPINITEDTCCGVTALSLNWVAPRRNQHCNRRIRLGVRFTGLHWLWQQGNAAKPNFLAVQTTAGSLRGATSTAKKGSTWARSAGAITTKKRRSPAALLPPCSQNAAAHVPDVALHQTLSSFPRRVVDMPGGQRLDDPTFLADNSGSLLLASSARVPHTPPDRIYVTIHRPINDRPSSTTTWLTAAKASPAVPFFGGRGNTHFHSVFMTDNFLIPVFDSEPYPPIEDLSMSPDGVFDPKLRRQEVVCS